MYSEYLKPFLDCNGELRFLGAWCFSTETRHLLLGRNGNIMILDNNLQKLLKNGEVGGEVGDELWFKLIQRGFAKHRQGGDMKISKRAIAPTFFMIEMTNACNMECRYCSRKAVESAGLRTITDDKLESICHFILKYCRENNISNIAVQPWGGEPLLQKEKIFRLQDIFKENGMEISVDIETNGTLLSEEIVSELHNRGIHYGISLDGFYGINDLQRRFRNGKGTYRKIVEGLELTRKYYGENVSILTTLTKQSIPYTGEILKFFAMELGLHKVKMNFVQKSSFKDDEKYCVIEDDVMAGAIDLFDTLVLLNETGINIMEYNVWVRMVNILTNRERDICLSRGCCGGRDMITFDTEGNIFPCDVTDFSEEKIGDIEMICNLTEAVCVAMKKNTYFVHKYANGCLNCPWEHFCGGGCTMRAKCAGNLPGEINSVDCTTNKILYPKIVELILERPLLAARMVEQ